MLLFPKYAQQHHQQFLNIVSIWVKGRETPFSKISKNHINFLKQVKPGFTNYQPRGLANQIWYFKQSKTRKWFKDFQKFTFWNFEKIQNSKKSKICLKFY